MDPDPQHSTPLCKRCRTFSWDYLRLPLEGELVERLAIRNLVDLEPLHSGLHTQPH